MKEISIEEKAKRYDEAITRGSRLWESDMITRENYEYIFPEVKESEDEKIGNQIIEHIKWSYDEQECAEEEMQRWISWLESQAEHAKFIDSIQIGDKVTRNQDGVLVNLSQLNRVVKKQGDRKPADKVKPKFEIDDVITNGILVGKIDEIHEFGYHAYFGDHFADVPDIENWHKWTIQDAKDGDVLAFDNDTIVIFKDLYNANSFHSYCHIEDGVFDINENETPNWWECIGFKPATKEQRDILFHKIKEAGYEWDADKKELKKEADNLHNYLYGERETAWSEEDDRMYNIIVSFIPQHLTAESYAACINWLKSLKDRVQPKQEWSKEDKVMLDEIIDFFENGTVKLQHDLSLYASWLKSIRPQNTWKPSEEMLEALYRVIPENVMEKSEDDMLLDKLYQGLKYGKVLSEK